MSFSQAQHGHPAPVRQSNCSENSLGYSAGNFGLECGPRGATEPPEAYSLINLRDGNSRGPRLGEGSFVIVAVTAVSR